MEPDLSRDYRVRSPRLAFIVVAIIGWSAFGFSVYEYFTYRFGVGPIDSILKWAVVLFAIATLLIGVFAVLGALRTTNPLTLTSASAEFRHPAIKIPWEDVQVVIVTYRSQKVLIDFELTDIHPYLSQLNPAERAQLEYDITANWLRFRIAGLLSAKWIRREIMARLDVRPDPPLARMVDEETVPQQSFCFNATYLTSVSRNSSVHAADRMFRVYFRDGIFFAIRIAGPLLEQGIKSPEEIARFDQSDPGQLLEDHKHNFSFALCEISAVRIEIPNNAPIFGPGVGWINFALKGGKVHEFQFEEIWQMRRAISKLPAFLGGLLEIKVQWDGYCQVYVGKQPRFFISTRG